MNNSEIKKIKLSIVIPCYNEEDTLRECVKKVQEIEDSNLLLEIIIVDDCSTDSSPAIGKELAENNSEITFYRHKSNRGKGAALRTGFKVTTGNFVAVQDADLEYNPKDLKNLLIPLIEDKADVVIGSRLLTDGPHRVLYFWHSLGNKFLTFLSNIFSDLNLTDMEAGYKIFKSEVIKKIEIEEDGFGFEPEIIAKISHLKLKIYEMGISYFGRTYEEGKKINYKDGIRALYCIFKYNAYLAPRPTKFLMYFFVAFFTVLINLLMFLRLNKLGLSIEVSVLIAFSLSAIINYPFIFFNLIRSKKRIMRSYLEFSIFWVAVILCSFLDLQLMKIFTTSNVSLVLSKIYSVSILLSFNFIIRKVWTLPIRNKKEL